MYSQGVCELEGISRLLDGLVAMGNRLSLGFEQGLLDVVGPWGQTAAMGVEFDVAEATSAVSEVACWRCVACRGRLIERRKHCDTMLVNWVVFS